MQVVHSFCVVDVVEVVIQYLGIMGYWNQSHWVNHLVMEICKVKASKLADDSSDLYTLDESILNRSIHHQLWSYFHKVLKIHLDEVAWACSSSLRDCLWDQTTPCSRTLLVGLILSLIKSRFVRVYEDVFGVGVSGARCGLKVLDSLI